mgnify:CR=1 FL=1
MDFFTKYCNCYSMPRGNIEVQCFDKVLEAIHEFESRPHQPRIESRLLYIKKFWPEFIQKIIIRNAFSKNVVFVNPSQNLFSYEINKDDADNVNNKGK